MKPSLKQRQDFAYFFELQTRWSDNDMYGHVNNVMYYSYFDTAANNFLIQKTGFDPARSNVIGLVVDSGCSFLQQLSFPESLEIGVAIAKIGRSSLRYELAIFKQGQKQPAAQGHMVHVFVTRDGHQPRALSEQLREALSAFVLKPD